MQASDLRALFDSHKWFGAEETSLWPMFAKDFASVIDESGKKDSKQIRGVGGALEIEAVTLPEVMLKIGGFETILRPAPVLLQETLPASKDYHGLLGWTLLQQARSRDIRFQVHEAYP